MTVSHVTTSTSWTASPTRTISSQTILIGLASCRLHISVVNRSGQWGFLDTIRGRTGTNFPLAAVRVCVEAAVCLSCECFSTGTHDWKLCGTVSTCIGGLTQTHVVHLRCHVIALRTRQTLPSTLVLTTVDSQSWNSFGGIPITKQKVRSSSL